MWRKLFLHLTTAVLMLGLAGSLLYTAFYFYTTWQTDQLSSRLSQQRSDAASALAPSPTAEPSRTPEFTVQTASAAPAENVGNTGTEIQPAVAAPTEVSRNAVAAAQPTSPAPTEVCRNAVVAAQTAFLAPISPAVVEAQDASAASTESAGSARM